MMPRNLRQWTFRVKMDHFGPHQEQVHALGANRSRVRVAEKAHHLTTLPPLDPVRNHLPHQQWSLLFPQWPYSPSHNWSGSKSTSMSRDCLRRRNFTRVSHFFIHHNADFAFNRFTISTAATQLVPLHLQMLCSHPSGAQVYRLFCINQDDLTSMRIKINCSNFTLNVHH